MPAYYRLQIKQTPESDFVDVEGTFDSVEDAMGEALIIRNAYGYKIFYTVSNELVESKNA